MTTDELNIIISADTGNAVQNIGNTADELNRLGETAQTADGDMSALVKAMSEAAAQMVAVSQNIAASASGVSGFKGSFEALNVTLQGISGQFDTLNATIQAMSFGDAAARVADLSVASEQSANALNGISTAADGFAQHMTTLSDATKGTAGGMDALTSEFSTALASIKNFSSDVSTAGQEAQETAQKIKDLAEQVNKIPKGSNVTDLTKSFRTLKGVIATLGIGAFIKDSQAAYETQMTNELKLTSHMKHRMNATDEEIQSIKELASEQQKLGVIGDEIQLAGAQQLTTYARQTSTLKTLIPAMNNLIAQNAGYEASVGDAVSAADMLGRAMNGQYTGLQRLLGKFSEAQIQVLKYGTEEEKAAVLADAINSKIGNMNELLNQTPTGQLNQLRMSLGDFQEELAATWQPLISSFLPVLKGLFDAIKQPIKDVAAGITVIGQAIAKVDSPAVRAIALTAAGIAVVNKLRLAIGATSAGILVAGVLLAGLIGSMQQEQENISDIVSDAMAGAADSTDDATDSMQDYREETEATAKAISRLAGFDTITKLSGGSLGSFSDMFKKASDEAEEAAEAVKKATEDVNIEIPIDIDSRKIGENIRKWVEDTDWQKVFLDVGTAFEGVVSGALGIVDGLFGTDLQTALDNSQEHFFEVGEKIYDAVQQLQSDDELTQLQGINTLLVSIQDILTLGLFSDQIEGWNHAWQGIGADLYDLLHPSEDVKKSHGIYTTENTPGIINQFSPIEGAPMAAYYKWGSSGMPTSIPKWQVTSMGEENWMTSDAEAIKERNESDRYDVPTKPVGMPTSAYEQMQATIIMDGEVMGTATMKIQEAQSLESNGLYGGR